MKCGLVGLPQSGKTTLFDLLIQGGHGSGETGRGHETRAHLGLLDIPDPRLEFLETIYTPEKATPARVEFIDTPSFPLHGSSSNTSAARFLADLREVDALIHVVGLHPLAAGSDGDPLAAYRLLVDEFVLADLEIIEKRLDRLEREARAGRKEGAREMELLLSFKGSLESGVGLSSLEIDAEAALLARGYGFLTLKPELAVLNVAEPSDSVAAVESALNRLLADRGAGEGTEVASSLVVFALMELEMCDLEAEERGEFMDDLGLDEPGADRLLKKVLDALSMIRFYTANEHEVRAWAVPDGIPVLEAAGKVHQDMQRGFIRAEVVKFDELRDLGGWSEAKSAGRLKLEGRDYPVEDGDVIFFRFKV